MLILNHFQAKFIVSSGTVDVERNVQWTWEGMCLYWTNPLSYKYKTKYSEWFQNLKICSGLYKLVDRDGIILPGIDTKFCQVVNK